MLIRISLIVAIVAALAAGVLNIVEVRDKINTLISQRDDEHTHRVQAETDLTNTKKDLAKTQSTLKQTQQDLADAKTARDKAVADDAAQVKKADQLQTQLTQVTAQRDDAQTKLAAYTATTFTPEQVLTLGKSLKAAQDALEVANEEKLVLSREVSRLTNQLSAFIGNNYVVHLPANLAGKVIAVDPKWDFVVLNVGEDQGVLQDGELLVSRAGKLVAKVIVRNVQKNRCIANIMPGWQLGEVFEGDRVIPAYPAS